MVKKHYLIIIYISSCILLFISSIYASNFTDNDKRNYFIPEDLQKSYYKTEIETIKFLNRQQSHVNGLIESFRGTSKYSYNLFTRSFCYTKGGSLDCQAFTYDNALAIMTYLLAGKTKKAKDLLSIYRKEFYYLKDDSAGLYNCYRTNIYNHRNLNIGIDGDRIHLGPTAWIGISALQYTAMTGDLRYLGFVIDIVKWINKLNYYKFDDGRKGGVCMGKGWGADWSNIFSTENNVDYYAVLLMLKKIHDCGDDRVKKIFNGKNFTLENINEEIEAQVSWMKEVIYNKEEKYFNCGYNKRGLDKTCALDNVSWIIAAYGPSKLEEIGINPFKLMSFAERNFLVSNLIEDTSIQGFDFTDSKGRRKKIRIIWMEGTGFHIIAYQIMARYALELGMEKQANEYREKSLKFLQELKKVSDIVAIIDNALPYTSKRLKEKEVLMTFADEWEIPRGNKGQWVGSVSSTIWRYYALTGFNPLKFDTERILYKLFSQNN